LERQGTSSDSTGDTAAHLVTDISSDNTIATTTTNTPSVTPTATSSFTDETLSVQALLDSAINMVPDNEAVRDMIAEVLNTTAEL